MTRVLITGMSGFIGRHVAAALQSRGVEAIDARHSGARDLLRVEDRAKAVSSVCADTLIHLAWVPGRGERWSSELNRDWEVATIDLVSRFFAGGGHRVISAGSCAEYDWSVGGVFSENTPLAPHTLYGSAKARTGEALLRVAEDYGASAAWARVFFLFGEGESPARFIPSMLSACMEGESIACGPHDTVRDFWDVRNLADVLAILALSDLSGPINVASGKGSSFEEIGKLIQKITGAGNVIRFGERLLSQGEPSVVVADTTRLRAEIRFQESVSLEAGLADYHDILCRGIPST